MHRIDYLSVYSINTTVLSLAIFSGAYKLTEFVLFVLDLSYTVFQMHQVNQDGFIWSQKKKR